MKFKDVASIPAVLILVVVGFSNEPNFIRSTLHDVGENGSGTTADVVSTEYIDGFGKSLQSKVHLGPAKDRVVCTYYDEMGRVIHTTKPFIDYEKGGAYLPGDLQTAASPVSTQLAATYNGDNNAFLTSSYYPDQFGEQRGLIGAGTAYTGDEIRLWYYGIGTDALSFPVNVSGVTVTVSFEDGFIVSALSEGILDALYTHLLDNPEFEPPNGSGTFYKLTVVKDFEGNYTQSLTDNVGQMVAAWADPSSTAGDEIIQRYEYDLKGNVVREIAPYDVSGATPVKLLSDAEYRYNVMGQLVWIKTPDGGEFECTYNKRGQIEEVTSFVMQSGTKTVIRTLRHTYDVFGRLERIDELDPGTGEYRTVIVYSYDKIPPAERHPDIPSLYLRDDVLYNLTGQLVAVTAINRTAGETYRITDFFSYDERGRVRNKYKLIPGMPLQDIRFEYDDHGKVLEECFSCGGTYLCKEYEYDELGRLVKVKDGTNGDKELLEYSYDDLGRVERKGLRAVTGYDVRFTYNIKDWLDSIVSPSGANGFSQFINAYDKNGNITDARYSYSVGGTAWDINLNYGYDNVNRLTSVTVASISSGNSADYEAAYGYDAVGRITRKKEGTNDYTGYTYFGQAGTLLTNRLKRAKNSGGEDYVFDKHGNLIVDFTKKMVIEYDWRNLPVVFRFYNDLSTAGITFDAVGGTCTNSNLYEELASNTGIDLVSKVTMIYDAGGGRVAKIEKDYP